MSLQVLKLEVIRFLVTISAVSSSTKIEHRMINILPSARKCHSKIKLALLIVAAAPYQIFFVTDILHCGDCIQSGQ